MVDYPGIKNCAKSRTTYDFSTLYTNLPYDKLKYKVSLVIDFAFQGGNKNFNKCLSNSTAFWGKKTRW